MIAAVVRIAPLGGDPRYPEPELNGLLSARARLDDRINHFRIRAGPSGFDILAFVATDRPSLAYAILRRAVQCCLADDPRLDLWRIV
ncbi:hypothetical protein Q3W71_02265 [Micromonospora sp. C28SCA-DRY-2]|uniref:hypothetical protein n=1 Tax=Micromonospora sp. C28SCA-DRY-2 TaxID=3059522 RepID=UPI002675F688|nr:hypothetical protein [Micromonospora sp. C28SCA-DRY-2]MDO3700502.1 hypothetical protein [Micromonospora sp. C28SCA-DRY-2]